MELKELLKQMVEKRASDLHLTVGVSPLLRIDGRLKETESKSLTPEEIQTLVYSILDQQEIESFQQAKALDKSLNIEAIGRFRVSLYRERGNIAAAIRLIPSHIPSFTELALPEVSVDFANKPKGLILICGATGSGKSTTMAAMIDHINRTRQCHIISVEDPIEYIHEHNSSVVNQREIGQDVTSFARGVREVLREDPDVVAIGEMRDLETIRGRNRTLSVDHPARQ
jgi:twitching motility protein PilT